MDESKSVTTLPRLSKILGSKFKKFISLLTEAKSIDPFLCRNMKNCPTNSDPNDINPEFFESMSLSALAFRDLEIPDRSRIDPSSKFVSNVRSVVQEMISRKFLVHGVADEGVIKTNVRLKNYPLSSYIRIQINQFPYIHNTNFKYLSPGFHLLGHKSKKHVSPLLMIIEYLYRYISLLDLSTVNGLSIVDLLYYDKTGFYPLIQALITDFQSESVSGELSKIPVVKLDSALKETVVEVAQKIIQILKSNLMPKTNIKSITKALTGTDQEILFKVLRFSDDDRLSNLVPYIKHEHGPNVDIIKRLGDISEQRFKNYGINGLMNPLFLNRSALKQISPFQNLSPELKGGRQMLQSIRVYGGAMDEDEPEDDEAEDDEAEDDEAEDDREYEDEEYEDEEYEDEEYDDEIIGRYPDGKRISEEIMEILLTQKENYEGINSELKKTTEGKSDTEILKINAEILANEIRYITLYRYLTADDDHRKDYYDIIRINVNTLIESYAKIIDKDESDLKQRTKIINDINDLYNYLLGFQINLTDIKIPETITEARTDDKKEKKKKGDTKGKGEEGDEDDEEKEEIYDDPENLLLLRDRAISKNKELTATLTEDPTLDNYIKTANIEYNNARYIVLYDYLSATDIKEKQMYHERMMAHYQTAIDLYSFILEKELPSKRDEMKDKFVKNINEITEEFAKHKINLSDIKIPDNLSEAAIKPEYIIASTEPEPIPSEISHDELPEPAVEKPPDAVEEPAVIKPAEEPPVGEPAAEEPPVGEPAAVIKPVEEPAVEEPPDAVEEPPAVEEPAVEEPHAVIKPAVIKPADVKPAIVEPPAVIKPASVEPAAISPKSTITTEPHILPRPDIIPRPRTDNNMKPFVSLPYLYGPVIDFKQDLITSENQGSYKNDAILNQINVDAVDEFVGSIRNITIPEHKLALVSIVAHLALSDGRISGLRERINKNFTEYNLINSRIQYLKNNRDSLIKNLSETFITEFSKRLSDTTVSKQSPKFKHTLSNPYIQQFYQDMVRKDPRFYKIFFNLISDDGESIELDSIITEQLTDYRLNVKKVTTVEKELMDLTGGAMSRIGIRPSDIMLVTYVPSYDSAKAMWISSNEKIDHIELKQMGRDALRIICREIYGSKPTSSTMSLRGHKIDFNQIINKPIVPEFGIDYNTYFKELLMGSYPSRLIVDNEWTYRENKLSEHILKSISDWKRVDNTSTFKRLDKNGHQIKNPEINNCAFITSNETECLDFLETCVYSDTVATACNKLLNTDLDVNLSINFLRERLIKINPSVALAILKKFKFESYISELNIRERPGSINNIKLYKIQSVGSWLNQLIHCSNLESENVCSKIKELGKEVSDKIIELSRDQKYHPFFKYLDMLVEWVNANPQVLNPSPIDPKLRFDKKVNTHSVTNNNMVINLGRELERLKSRILNQIGGYNAQNIITNISSIPGNIHMPFNKLAFITPTPPINHISIYGGYDSDLTDPSNFNDYQALEEIYVYLKSVMKIPEKIDYIILDELVSLSDMEASIKDQIRSLMTRNKLYSASNGYTNSYTVANNKLDVIQLKHKNLSNLIQAYNQRSVDVLNSFQKLINQATSIQ